MVLLHDMFGSIFNMFGVVSSMTDEGISNGTNDTWMNSMVLHFTKNQFILVNFWHTATILGFSGSVVAVFLLSVLYEAVKALRLYFARNRAVELQNQRIQSNIVVRESSEHVDSVSSEMYSYPSILGCCGIRTMKQMFTFYRIVQSSLYFAQIFLAYALMLTAMTFNVWIILGIVCGQTIGYFLFSDEPTFDGKMEICC